MSNNYLVEELRKTNQQWEDAYEVWESLRGKEKKSFEENELKPLRTRGYEIEQQIISGVVITVEEIKEKELIKLEKQYAEACEVYTTLKGKKRLLWEVNELAPIKVRIYNLNVELNK